MAEIKHRVTSAPTYAPPVYCAACGRTLMSGEQRILGAFDQWTAARIPDTNRQSLRCDQFDGETDEGLSHDLWVRSDTGWVIV